MMKNNTCFRLKPFSSVFGVEVSADISPALICQTKVFFGLHQMYGRLCVRPNKKDHYSKKYRYFKRNVWQDHFVDGIKESSPQCVFNFMQHNASDAKHRQNKGASPIFQARGSCNCQVLGEEIKNCNVKIIHSYC